ncbi:MAG: TatD family hydrolase [Clostridia bacterium]|nr:TatD family hydrolase [Clostridia bacterium]
MSVSDQVTIDSLTGGIYRPVFDTHAHYLDEAFDACREDLIRTLQASSVVHVMEAACELSDVPKVIGLCEKYPGFFVGAAGIHPHQADSFSEDSVESLRASFGSCPSLRAVGEIGMDYHYDFSPREIQKTCFDAQLSLAGELGLPVIIHDREAHGDCLDLLKSHRGRLSGVMHCFSGSYETARECLDLGLYLGIGGSLTFRNAKKLVEIVPRLPLDRIVLETDCPYMTPEPFRGRVNDSRYIQLVLKRISELRPESADFLAPVFLKNSLSLFGM